MLEALGFDSTTFAVYGLLLADRAGSAGEIARRLDLREADIRAALERLADLELLSPAAPGEELRPVNPAVGLQDLLDRQKRELRRGSSRPNPASRRACSTSSSACGRRPARWVSNRSATTTD